MAPQHRLYSLEIAEEIIDRLSAGETLRAICRDEKMPLESTVRNWVKTDHDGFAAQYAHARELGAYAMADELLEVADNGSNDWMARHDPENPGYDLNGEHIQRSKARLDTRKWLLSKVLPKVFGDKQQLEHTGADGSSLVPVLNVTVSRD